jgi:hypothetical protein
MKGMTRYHLMSFLHELVLFFIGSFLFFPSHIKRIIFFFVYLIDHQPSFIYPSLEEADLLFSCVVDVDIISSTHPTHKDELHIETPLELNHPCSHGEVETDPQPPQISSDPIVTIEPCHQCVKPHIQPTSFKLESETSCLNL